MIDFYKYHGAGNDFILIDARAELPNLSQPQIEALCKRNFGVGADGLMYLLASDTYDFEMKYFNSDGLEGSMCGNGGRCIAAFAFDRGIEKNTFQFLATDGVHYAEILEHNGNYKLVKLQMQDVHDIETIDEHLVLDTGSPHHLTFCKSISGKNVFAAGQAIRYSEKFKEEGINANFIEQKGNELFVRTYERGVENETLACGTGVTAAAIGAYINSEQKHGQYQIKTLGGTLKVSFKETNGYFRDVFLEGPTEYVFRGSMEV